ncbi:VOC family protein [Nocardia jejuensis]|uniref:VOC family protein n=1 Tax=Nocardia jejuensis TaxID=328049 RepID=UPI000829D91F|nr:VOC family protein [Nocardia jejuensis]
MTETTSVQAATVIWPTMTYRDPNAAIAFLEKAFGFRTVAKHGAGDMVAHAEMSWPGGGGIMLGSWREDSPLSCSPPASGSVYIVVEDPDALYASAVAAGATITRELLDETDYESRGFTCRDPEGVSWSFGTYPGEPAE